ncbi:MAG: efflux RND transporter periplasmic adaptor subunit [Solibacillus sp.]
MLKKKWPLLSAVLCSSLIISACSSGEVEEVAAREAISVAVAKATSESLDAMSSVSGTLQAYRTVEVAYELGGVVSSVNVAVGDKVAQGTVLSSLDDSDFARQVALVEKSVEQAKVSVDVSGLAVKSASNSKSTAEASAAAAEAGLSAADAGILAADSGLAAADAQIASAEAALQAVLDGARSQERAQLQITVDNAQKAYDTAKTNVERMEALYAEGLISKQELESVQNGFNSAKNGLAQAKESYSLMEEGATASQIKQTEAALAAAQSGKAQAASGKAQADSGKAQAASGKTQANAGINQAAIAIDQAKASQNQAQVVYEQALINKQAAEATLAKTVLKSPMAGVVLSKTIEPGSNVSGGTSVMTIGDLSKLKVMLPVPDSEISEWKVGDTVNLSVYGSTKKGTVNMISPQTNSGTGTVGVEVVVPNEDGEWLAGQIVSASKINADNNGILVPIEAVINNGIESYVFKSVDDKAVKVIVETGAMVNNKIHITKGIKEGDQVVVSGGTLLLDGDPLKTSGGSAK